MEVSKGDLHILHHSLGITDPRRPGLEPYRNHFVAGEGHADMPRLQRLMTNGLMECLHSKSPIYGGNSVFFVTTAGRAVAIKTRPRLKRGAQRYSRYLMMKEVDPDLTFHQFLTDPDYAVARDGRWDHL